MIEFAEPRVIRTATENDIEPLQKHVPKGDTTLHARRYEEQKGGDVTYLIAVQGDVPVGHALVKWKGATDEPIAGNLADPTPDVEDLFVHETHRNRRVGSRLLETAERLAREREYKQIGLSCGAENTDARALYTARGYLDSGIAPYTLSGKYKDATGAEQEWMERDCTYFLLPLAEVAAATETNMENNNTNTAAEETPQQTTPSEMNVPPKTPEKPVSEQVVDFAFGVALTAAEALEKVVRTAQTEAPGVWEALQEKGRPARQKLVQSLREETREETEAVTQGKVEVDPTDDGGDGEVLQPKPMEPIVPIKPAPRPFGFGRLGSVSAEDEIKALEDRVKTLEREVVSPPAPVRGDASLVTEDAVNVSEQTSAEKGTALVDFTPETSQGDA
ncbi:MAG: GNAT family N-acetyltransferase, partial [Akkermansiaceae bacterium]|nr:GNAT family N-acetyltransferase [Armatimonadota bacterium]